MKRSSIITGICCLTLLHTTRAAIRLPALISDNMVLQQQSEVALWGWADPGEEVRITPSWSGKTVQVTTAADGRWQLPVKTGKAGGPYSIAFSGDNQLFVHQVLLGEVWLASGQSNMEFYMDKAEGWRTGVLNYQEEIAKANDPYLRMIDVPNTVADSVREQFEGHWDVCTPQTAGNFSAVAYYFAARIRKETGYPVGIINATWGGTPAESWTKRSVLEKDTAFYPMLERYQKALNDYPEAYERYKEKQAAWKADTSSKKKGGPKEPMGPHHNKSPYKLYNGMIAPLVPYTLKGVIWYQGESNADYAYNYRKLFPAMIGGWREDWHNKSLPFYFVQIAPHKGQNPVIRESQLYTWQHVSHTGMVVTTDVGDANDIHPRDKKTVGNRLALWALHDQYGQRRLETSGPLWQSMKRDGSKIILRFAHADGLKSNGDTLSGFTIAGSDQQFVPAKAEIRGNTVIVWSDAVQEPAAVRFGWSNVPVLNLYNKEGLPAGPFRTDEWAVETQDKR